MDIKDAENTGSIFLKAEHDAYEFDYVENIYIGGQCMPVHVKNTIADHLRRLNITIDELHAGARLTDDESRQLQSALSDPQLSTLEKVSAFLGTPIAALCGDTHQPKSVTINIENIQVDGNYISVQGDYVCKG